MAKLFVDSGPLRQYPEFRRLWIGFVVSSIGIQLQVVAVQYQVFTLTKSVLDVGLVALVQLVPAIIGSILGGSLADAIDRRRLLLVTESAMAFCSLGLALNSRQHAQVWIVLVLAALNAGFSGCDNPTRNAVMMTIVDRSDFVAASALRQLIQQISIVVGPSVGGVLLAGLGIEDVYWVNLATFSAALIAVLTLSAHPPVGGGTRFGVASIVEGFSFLKGRQAIQGCFVADLNAMILGMPTALFPALGLLHFHGGARTVGFLYAAPGGGALIAALFSGWTNQIRRQGRAVVIAIVIWGAAIAIFGLTSNLVLALFLLGVAGGADVISAVFRSTILQSDVPDSLRGRLSAIQMAVVSSGPRLGNFEAGAVASAFGNEVSIVSGGIGCIVGIVLIARAMPRFGRYELAPERPSQLSDEVAHSEGDSD